MGLWYITPGNCFESLVCNACFAVAKSKDHLKSLERGFEIWNEGNTNELYKDGKVVG